MTRYVALLRAVNVAGHTRISARDLVQIFSAAGASAVSSFGHAGNLLFSTSGRVAAIVAKARAEIERRHGEPPDILLRTAAGLRSLEASQPFAMCNAGARTKLYVTFLSRKPRAIPALPLELPAERLTIVAIRGPHVLLTSEPKRNGFYGMPNAFVEATFGVRATTRNWSTVARLAALAAR